MRLHFHARFLCFALATVFALPAFAAGELKPWTGGVTPLLTLSDLGGRSHRLADFRDKVVVINFWATWCEPCRDEIPSLQRLKDRLADRPFAETAAGRIDSLDPDNFRYSINARELSA